MKALLARLLAWAWYDRAQVGTVILGIRRLPVRRINLGQLGSIIPAYRRVFATLAEGGMSEATMLDMIGIVAVATRRAPEDIADMPCTSAQIIAAMHVIAEAAGLQAQEGSDLGELARAASSMLESLLPSSPAQPAGQSNT